MILPKAARNGAYWQAQSEFVLEMTGVEFLSGSIMSSMPPHAFFSHPASVC